MSNPVKAIFHGKGGREPEQEHARKLLEVGKEYEVVDLDMGPFLTFITLKDVEGDFNSCMFDVNYGELAEMNRNLRM